MGIPGMLQLVVAGMLRLAVARMLQQVVVDTQLELEVLKVQDILKMK